MAFAMGRKIQCGRRLAEQRLVFGLDRGIPTVPGRALLIVGSGVERRKRRLLSGSERSIVIRLGFFDKRRMRAFPAVAASRLHNQCAGKLLRRLRGFLLIGSERRRTCRDHGRGDQNTGQEYGQEP